MAQGKEYTLEFIQEELTSLLDALKSDIEIIYIWELFLEKDYTRNRYAEWVNKYPDDEIVQTTSGTIKGILETRAIKWAMTNKLNPTATIFHLKNNYKWVDKQEIDQKTEHSFQELSNEQVQKIAKQALKNGEA